MLARIDEAFPLLRTTCDGAMRIIIAFVADASSVCEILPTSLSRRGQPPLAGLRDRPLLSRSNGGNGSGTVLHFAAMSGGSMTDTGPSCPNGSCAPLSRHSVDFTSTPGVDPERSFDLP
jgi:hypothetical protein